MDTAKNILFSPFSFDTLNGSKIVCKMYRFASKYIMRQNELGYHHSIGSEGYSSMSWR